MILLNYLIMCFIFGTTFLAIKIGMDAGAPPFMSAGIRFFFAGAILYCFMFWKKKVPSGLLFRKELFLTGLGLTFGTFSTLYWAEQYVSSGVAAVLSATGPIMILFLQNYIVREKATKLSLLGCFIGVFGVFLLILPSFSIEMSLLWLLGCILVIVGEVSFAAGTLYSKRVSQSFKDISSIALNSVQMMHGGVLLIILSLFTEQVQMEQLTSFHALGSLVYLMFVGSMIGHTLYYWLVVNTNPVFPSTWLYVSPIIAIIFGALFYNELITPMIVLGAVTIMIGTILVNATIIQGSLMKVKALSRVPKKKNA
ncbi:DMT family transporter [Bacillus sp. DJP31]|uniref:DMT family transporter n=1 Tax=Bacillus sp. DJP31 TaxID=3409789 RepID=UPI003BB4D8AF